jgi:polysaccharide biosynthesis/export protein
MTRTLLRLMVLCVVVGSLVFSVGCNSLGDPSEVTRGFTSTRLVVPILNTVDPIDEGDVEFQGASDVTPADLRTDATDYVIGPNDLVQVSIFDLLQRDVESIRTARVSQTGLLQLPMLPQPVKAGGLSEAELQRAIADAYKQAGLMDQAQVTVTVIDARQRTFNITGAVSKPGQYVILESDFRLLQALVQAGDTTFPADYAYIIRKRRQEAPAARQQPQQGTEQAPTTPTTPTTQPSDLTPRSQGSIQAPVLAMVQQAATQTPPASGEGRFIYIDGKPVFVPAAQDTTGVAPAVPPVQGTETARPPVRADGQSGTQAAGTEDQPFEFGADSDYPGEIRVIRVPLTELKSGDLRYNVAVRPDDMIIVPLPAQGEYYMSGHVGSPGAYSLTGRKITLKQAISAARMLDPLAVPWRTDLVRRIGTDRELIVRVNLQQIFFGKQPDIYLKPNDVVMVGSDWYPPFLVALRNAFRITYGFGFIYDRNFAPSQTQRFEPTNP